MSNARVVLMASRTVRPLDLEKTLKEVLKEYGDQCYEVLNDCVKDVAQEAEEKLQSVRHFARDTSGEYSRSWTITEEPTARLKTKLVIHNQDHYRLTHLLENGHVSRNGTGRTFGFVKAYPHIAPVNDWARQKLPELVKERLSK